MRQETNSMRKAKSATTTCQRAQKQRGSKGRRPKDAEFLNIFQQFNNKEIKLLKESQYKKL